MKDQGSGALAGVAGPAHVRSWDAGACGVVQAPREP